MHKLGLSSLVVIFLAGLAWAEEPVHFADQNLQAAVEEALWISDPTPADMLALTTLDAGSRQVSSLTGLEHAKNLQTLHARFNWISDLSPLSGLGNLETLNLGENEISDLSPLSGLANLKALHLNQNRISDVSPLSSVTSLQILDVHNNRVSDVSPLSTLTNVWNLALRENPLSDISPLSVLSGLEDLSLLSTLISDVSPLCSLTSLRFLDLRSCPLSQDSHKVYIPQIRANNPHMFIQLDPYAGRILSVSSTAGGSVTDPGEGDFTYVYDAVVHLEVSPKPGFLFTGWSVTGWTGTYPISLDQTWITMTQDYEIRATFLSLLDTLYVDDDARHDPGPEDATLSDLNEDGTPEHPFDRIQEAIDVAPEGASIVVRPGTYRENIDVLGKSLNLMGMDLNDPDRGPCAVIQGAEAGPVVQFDGSEDLPGVGPIRALTLFAYLDTPWRFGGPKQPWEYYGIDLERFTSRSTFTGFVVTGGNGRLAGAICCTDASPTITHCLIVGNRATDPNGAAVYCENSHPVLTNCTIADNYAGKGGAGLTLIDSDVTVLNSILWNHAPQEVLRIGAAKPDIRYSTIRGWWPDKGNIDLDPLFARPGWWVNPEDPSESLDPGDTQGVWMEGDYHLQSETGRWEPGTVGWVQDQATSPCIDAGDPGNPVGHEPVPNGGRINMGAYGDTSEASKSSLGL